MISIACTRNAFHTTEISYFITSNDRLKIFHSQLKPFLKRVILHFTKLREFADDKNKFDDNSEKISNSGENSVIKGEIARYEQFISCFPVGYRKYR